MPRFQIDIQKRNVGEYWTNRYFVRAADINIAHQAANTILVPMEKLVHAAGVTFDRLRTSTTTPGDLIFRTNPLSGDGTLPANGNALPLFNVVRIDFGVSEGRPSRKFYRSMLGGGDVAGSFEWVPSVLAAITSALTDAMESLETNDTPLVDPQDQDLFGLTTHALIGMRQLRRGTKQRTEPII